MFKSSDCARRLIATSGTNVGMTVGRCGAGSRDGIDDGAGDARSGVLSAAMSNSHGRDVTAVSYVSAVYAVT